jgi:hypothetical protein
VLVVLAVLAELAPQRDVPYIVLGLLLSQALRVGRQGAATAIIVVCSMRRLEHGAQRRALPDSITDSLVATQLFIAIAALTSLLLVALTAERTRAVHAWRPPKRLSPPSPEQAALRRVATIVAGEAPPVRLFARAWRSVASWGLPAPASCATTERRRRRASGSGAKERMAGFPVGATGELDGDTVVARCCAAAGSNAWSATRRGAGASATCTTARVRHGQDAQSNGTATGTTSDRVRPS